MTDRTTTIQVPPLVEQRIQELTAEFAEVLGETQEATRRMVEISVLKCCACGDSVGWIFCEAKTLFGTEEDERMLGEGRRARVYG